MKITVKIAMEIANHEALIRQAYLDSKGNWTWGIGLTAASGHDPKQYINKPQSLQRCMDIYINVLEVYASEVRAVFAGYKLNEAQFAAALSFHWHTGAIKKATWAKDYKRGDVKEARNNMMNWRSQYERRKKERNLFFDGAWSGSNTIPEYPRLTQKHTPVWSSRVKTPAQKEIARAIVKLYGKPEFNLFDFILKFLKGFRK